jgi:hypothetical protein
VKQFDSVPVPPGVVTLMLFRPGVPAGVVHVIVVGLTTVMPVAFSVPTFTTVAPVKFVPVTVIDVPPLASPPDGDTPVTVGNAKYVKAPAEVTVPPGVVTTMSRLPADAAGVRHVIRVEEATTLVAATPPIVTDVAPPRFVPLIVSAVFPASGPPEGVTTVIVGTPWCVKPFASVAVPPGVVTDTLFAPAAPEGAVHVSDVSLATTTDVANVEPKRTAVVPVRPVPETVTLVPPATGPPDGDTAAIVGGRYTYVKAPASAVVPPGAVTDTDLAPPTPAGVRHVIVESSRTVTAVAGAPPMVTPVAPRNPVPVTVTGVPPPAGPDTGRTPATVGAAR